MDASGGEIRGQAVVVDLQHDGVDAAVGGEYVAPSAQDEKIAPLVVGEIERTGDAGGVAGAGEYTDRSTDAERRQIAQGNVTMHRERGHSHQDGLEVAEGVGTIAPARRSVAYAVAAVVLPVSFVLYVVSLTMYVAQIVRRIEVLGLGRDDVETFRLFDTIESLWTDGQIGLAVIIIAFTLFFPIGKYLALGFVMIGRYDAKRATALRWVKNLGQWSMGDVFVVALLVVIVRVNASFAQIEVEPLAGLWVFASSVILSMVASAALGFHFDRR